MPHTHIIHTTYIPYTHIYHTHIPYMPHHTHAIHVHIIHATYIHTIHTHYTHHTHHIDTSYISHTLYISSHTSYTSYISHTAYISHTHTYHTYIIHTTQTQIKYRCILKKRKRNPGEEKSVFKPLRRHREGSLVPTTASVDRGRPIAKRYKEELVCSIQELLG